MRSACGASVRTSDASRVAPEEVVAFLRDHDVPALKAERYRNGVASDNFCVATESDGDLVVRCDYRRDLAAVVTDRLYMAAASRSGVAVPSGPWIDGHIRDTPACARPVVPGRTVLDLHRSVVPGPELLSQILAKVHASEAPGVERAYFHRFLFDADDPRWGLFPEVLPHFAAKVDAAHLYADARRVVLRERAPLSGPVGLIHGDYTPSNILLTPRGITVLDWEKACTGFQISDIAQYLFHFSWFWNRQLQDFVGVFLDAYRDERSFELERETQIWEWLEVFAAAFFATDAAFAVANRALPDPNPVREKYFVGYCCEAFDAFQRRSEELRDAVVSASSRWIR